MERGWKGANAWEGEEGGKRLEPREKKLKVGAYTQSILAVLDRPSINILGLVIIPFTKSDAGLNSESVKVTTTHGDSHVE